MNILEASRDGKLERVQELLNADPSLVNACGLFWDTPLRLAVKGGHRDVELYLMRHGASVDAQTWTKETPLHVAARKGNEIIALDLLHYGASVDAQNADEETPLQIAAQNGHIKMVRFLINWPYYQRFLKRQAQEGLVALCGAQHPRLGADSPAKVLPYWLYQQIGGLVARGRSNHAIEQVYDMAEQERAREISEWRKRQKASLVDPRTKKRARREKLIQKRSEGPE